MPSDNGRLNSGGRADLGKSVFTRHLAPGPQLSADEAIRKLRIHNRSMNFSSAVRNLFGGEELKALAEYFNSPDIIELDALIMAGDITKEDVGDYLHQLPQYAASQRAMFRIVKRLAERVSRNLEQQQHLVDSNSYRKFIRLFGQLHDVLGFPNYETFRNSRVEEIISRVFESVFLQVQRILIRSGNSAILADMIRYHNSLSENALSRSDNCFAFDVHGLMRGMGHAADGLSDMMNNGQEDSPVSSQDKDMHYMMMEELVEMSQLNAVVPDSFVHDGYQVHILPPDPQSRFAHLCQLNIFKLGSDIVFCGPYDRSTGHIFIGNTRLLLSELLADVDYFGLRTAVANRLYDQLFAAEQQRIVNLPKMGDSDMHLLEKTDPEMRAVDYQEAVHAAAAEVAGEEIEFSSGKVSLSEPPLSAPLQQDGGICSRVLLLARLRSLKAREAIAAFKRLIGKPSRVQGSHYMFTRGGVSYPIPFHPSQTVTPGIILRGLKTFQISDQDFLEAL